MTGTNSPEYVSALRFRALTRFYDAIVSRTTRERVFKHALLEQASITADQHVLDLACGTGTLTLWAKQRQPRARLTGVDGDPVILALAQRKAQRAGVADVTFDHALATALPYPAAQFDCVLSSLFFHHLTLTNKRRVAAEAFRVLKPGGALHVADWGYPANALMRALFLSIRLLDGFAVTRDNVRGRLPNLFREAGFEAVGPTLTYNTVWGTLALYAARKPGAPGDSGQVRGVGPTRAYQVSPAPQSASKH